VDDERNKFVSRCISPVHIHITNELHVRVKVVYFEANSIASRALLAVTPFYGL